MDDRPNQMAYPNEVTFKDSRVTWVLLSLFFGGLFALVLFTHVIEGKAEPNTVWASAGFFVIALLFILMPPTVSELSPAGVKIKAAFSQPIFRKWEDISDFRVYRSRSRRFVTFQDPTKTLQKHVFLVPVDIWSKPETVLEIVKAYQDAVLQDQPTPNISDSTDP